MERNCDVSPGLLAAVKAATRELVAAMAAPGQTGPQRVAALTGHSAGTVTRWQGDGYPELIPLAVLVQLEMTSGRAVFGRLVAGLTGHELVKLDDTGADGAGLLARVVRVGATHSAWSLEAMEAVADGTVTPREARALLEAGRKHQAEMGEAMARLAAIAGGEDRP